MRRRLPPAQLAAADAAGVATAVAAVFCFVDGQQPGRIGLRLTRPDVTLDGGHPGGTVLEVSCEDRQFIVTTVKEELHRLTGCRRGVPSARTHHVAAIIRLLREIEAYPHCSVDALSTPSPSPPAPSAASSTDKGTGVDGSGSSRDLHVAEPDLGSVGGT